MKYEGMGITLSVDGIEIKAKGTADNTPPKKITIHVPATISAALPLTTAGEAKWRYAAWYNTSHPNRKISWRRLNFRQEWAILRMALTKKLPVVWVGKMSRRQRQAELKRRGILKRPIAQGIYDLVALCNFFAQLEKRLGRYEKVFAGHGTRAVVVPIPNRIDITIDGRIDPLEPPFKNEYINLGIMRFQLMCGNKQLDGVYCLHCAEMGSLLFYWVEEPYQVTDGEQFVEAQMRRQFAERDRRGGVVSVMERGATSTN